jgi:hypothetical protein
MDDVFAVMSGNLAELQKRRQPDEEFQDHVHRWIKGRLRP